MYQTKDLAIVILNWNGKTLIEKFLPTLLKYSEDALICVADNASTDNSVAYISENFPTVKQIQNTENGGFAKGYNDALKQVESPIICLLNNDVEVTKNWLQPIIKTFNTDKNTAIIQPKILDFKHKSHFEYAGAAGGFIDKYGYPFCRGRVFDSIEKDNGQYNDTISIFWASGACLFIKKDIFNELNGFDESYFAHMEEIDLCWRAFNANYKTKYEGTSTIYHLGGATLNHLNPKKTYLNFRNSLFTLVKNTDTKLITRTLTRMILDGIAAFRFLLQLKPLHSFAILKAHISFYKNLKPLLSKRKQGLKKENYYYCNSIVWLHFIKKSNVFVNKWF